MNTPPLSMTLINRAHSRPNYILFAHECYPARLSDRVPELVACGLLFGFKRRPVAVWQRRRVTFNQSRHKALPHAEDFDNLPSL